MCEGLRWWGNAKWVCGSKEFPHAWNSKHKKRPGKQPGLREARGPTLRDHRMTVKSNVTAHWHGLRLHYYICESCGRGTYYLIEFQKWKKTWGSAIPISSSTGE